jgi:lysine-specific demethylase 8
MFDSFDVILTYLMHVLLLYSVGKKTFLLGAPSDTNYMYRNTSIATKNQTSSKVDMSLWLQGDIEERNHFPNIAEAMWYIAELRPGDILYTPPGWWHHVKSVDASISVLVPFDPAATESLCVLQSV